MWKNSRYQRNSFKSTWNNQIIRVKGIFTIFNKEAELTSFLKLAEKFHNIKYPIRIMDKRIYEIHRYWHYQHFWFFQFSINLQHYHWYSNSVIRLTWTQLLCNLLDWFVCVCTVKKRIFFTGLVCDLAFPGYSVYLFSLYGLIVWH